jgi:D-alanyl-D-alanine carboxypeptidase
MGTKRRLFWYLSLFLVVIVTSTLSSQVIKKEEPKKKETNLEKEPKVLVEAQEPLSITSGVRAKSATEISSGVFITDKGDDLLVLINKNIRLPETYEPSDLVSIDGLVDTTREGMMLRKEAAQALKKMTKAAKKDSTNPVILSAYRSYWTQAATFSMWVGLAGLDSAETFSARAGHSQHQLGTTIDLTSEKVNLGLTKDLTNTKEGLWMAENAYKYGFVLSYPEGKEGITGYTYEPWHYRYIGSENAKKMIDSGLILEEFLQKFGVV